MRLAVALSLMVVAALSLGAASAQSGSHAAVGREVAIELARAGHARVIVAFREQAAAARTVRERVLERLGARSGFRATAHWDAVSAVPGVVEAAGLARLLRDPDVVRIDLDRGGRGGTMESLPLVRSDVAHAAGVTGQGVTIAVLDSGIDRTHPDLADALVGEHCFVVPTTCTHRRAASAHGSGCE